MIFVVLSNNFVNISLEWPGQVTFLNPELLLLGAKFSENQKPDVIYFDYVRVKVRDVKSSVANPETSDHQSRSKGICLSQFQQCWDR